MKNCTLLVFVMSLRKLYKSNELRKLKTALSYIVL